MTRDRSYLAEVLDAVAAGERRRRDEYHRRVRELADELRRLHGDDELRRLHGDDDTAA